MKICGFTFRKNLKIMKYIESFGINMYSKSIVGVNVYLIACSNKVIEPKKCLKILKYLESRGHNIYIKNSINQNAYNYALCNHNLLLIKYLDRRGFKTDLNFAIHESNIKIVNYIRRQIRLRLNRMRMVFIFVPQNSLGTPK